MKWAVEKKEEGKKKNKSEEGESERMEGRKTANLSHKGKETEKEERRGHKSRTKKIFFFFASSPSIELEFDLLNFTNNQFNQPSLLKITCVYN